MLACLNMFIYVLISLYMICINCVYESWSLWSCRIVEIMNMADCGDDDGNLRLGKPRGEKPELRIRNLWNPMVEVRWWNPSHEIRMCVIRLYESDSWKLEGWNSMVVSDFTGKPPSVADWLQIRWMYRISLKSDSGSGFWWWCRISCEIRQFWLLLSLL